MKTNFVLFVAALVFSLNAAAQTSISEKTARDLASFLLQIPSNDPKKNTEELNRELKRRGLTTIDVTSPDFKFEPVEMVGISENGKMPFVGATVSDGKTRYCLPCRTGGNMNGKDSWGSATMTSTAADGVSVTPVTTSESTGSEAIYAKYDFRCDGEDYVAIERCVNGDAAACKSNPGKNVKTLVCPKVMENNLDLCRSDDSERTSKVCIPIWQDRAKNRCKDFRRDEFQCSLSVDLPAGGKSNIFESVVCGDSKRELFCSTFVLASQGIEACAKFSDARGIWKKCYDEYKEQKALDPAAVARYAKLTGQLGICASAASKYCGKVSKDLQITKPEYICLLKAATALNRQYMEGFDDTQCSTLVRTGGKTEPAATTTTKPATRPAVAPKKAAQ